jgi:hypothetical protein
MPSVKAAVAAVLVVEGPLQHPQVGLVLAALVFPTPFRLGLLRLMAAVAAVDRSLMRILPVDRVAAVVAHLELVARQQQVRQTLGAAVAAELPTGRKTLQVAAPVSWWFATASLNFSTGEANETIDSGHCCGTDPDGLRYQPRRLLQRHRCA